MARAVPCPRRRGRSAPAPAASRAGRRGRRRSGAGRPWRRSGNSSTSPAGSILPERQAGSWTACACSGALFGSLSATSGYWPTVTGTGAVTPAGPSRRSSRTPSGASAEAESLTVTAPSCGLSGLTSAASTPRGVGHGGGRDGREVLAGEGDLLRLALLEVDRRRVNQEGGRGRRRPGRRGRKGLAAQTGSGRGEALTGVRHENGLGFTCDVGGRHGASALRC